MIYLLLAVTLLLQTPSPTQAVPDMSIFGLALEKPFAVPECAKRKIGKEFMYLGPAKVICFKRSYGKENETGPVTNAYISVEYPILELPLGVNNSLGVYILDGKLEGVVIGTSGLNSQDNLLDKLKQKYGTPSLLESRSVQNRFGATFQTFRASWVLPNLTVAFDGVESSLDHGLITVCTSKGAAERERHLRELFKERRPF